MISFCPGTCPVGRYTPKDLGKHDITKVECEYLDDWRDTWRNMRIAVAGKRAVSRYAYKLEWLELPEHMQYRLKNAYGRLEKEMAHHAAKSYYDRAPFDESVRVAIKITAGSVFRIDTEYEGFDEEDSTGLFKRSNLDVAEMSLGDFKSVERYLLDERLTTGMTASYVFMRDVDGTETPTIKHYTVENIVDMREDDFGALIYILFREVSYEETENRFERGERIESYRELSLEDGVFVERFWKSDDETQFEADTDVAIVLRGENLTHLPVVIIGDGTPPFEALFEKTRELFQVAAQIKYREYKISHPTLHINYTESGELAYVCPQGEVRGEGSSQTESDPDDEDDTPQPIVPGMALETQNTEVKYIYDTGQGLDHLFAERERAQDDLERLGGHYGITKTASNVAEGTERMRQGREAAFITNYVVEVSEGLTEIARWTAFFSGIVDEARLNAIVVTLNTQLADDGPGFTLTDVRDLFTSGAIDSIIAIRLLRILLPAEVFEEDMTDEQIVARIEAAQFGDDFTPPE